MFELHRFNGMGYVLMRKPRKKYVPVIGSQTQCTYLPSCDCFDCRFRRQRSPKPEQAGNNVYRSSPVGSMFGLSRIH